MMEWLVGGGRATSNFVVQETRRSLRGGTMKESRRNVPKCRELERTSNCVPAVSGCRPSVKPPCGSSTCGGGAPSAVGRGGMVGVGETF